MMGNALNGRTLLTGLAPVRRVFFSFHFQRDIWRVNVVKNHWITKETRTAAGYFDGSLTEKAKSEGKAVVKRLINEGLQGSSVLCVLTGAETYKRHWVDYEIFKAIEMGKGVFGVRIHGIANQEGQTDFTGSNPFSSLGYAGRNNKLIPQAKYTSGWKDYADADPISASCAPYLAPGGGYDLAGIFAVYDWVADRGNNNFSDWVHDAALQAER